MWRAVPHHCRSFQLLMTPMTTPNDCATLPGSTSTSTNSYLMTRWVTTPVEQKRVHKHPFVVGTFFPPPPISTPPKTHMTTHTCSTDLFLCVTGPLSPLNMCTIIHVFGLVFSPTSTHEPHTQSNPSNRILTPRVPFPSPTCPFWISLTPHAHVFDY
jgi:hypothetical protein